MKIISIFRSVWNQHFILYNNFNKTNKINFDM